jgi:hypothetical protein
MPYWNPTACCGVAEIGELREADGPEEALKDLLTNDYDEDVVEDGEIKKGFVIFTEANNGDYGKKFQAYIKRNKLGTCIRTEDRPNPNHSERGRGRGVRVFVWGVNHKNLRKWAKKHKVQPVEPRRVPNYYDDEPYLDDRY